MSDYIVRATAADSQIRAFAATTRDLVENARNAHNTSPVATAALGRLLTAGSHDGQYDEGGRRCTYPSDQSRRSVKGHYSNGRFSWKCKRICGKSKCRDSG